MSIMDKERQEDLVALKAVIDGCIPPTMKQSIRDVAHALAVEHGRERYVDEAVSHLARIALLAPLAKRGAAHPTFRDLGKQETEKELQYCTRRLKKALESLQSLHAPAIAALADAGVVHRTACLELDRLFIGVQTAAANVSRVPLHPKRGPAKSDLFERGVMDNFAQAYFSLTGEHLKQSTRCYTLVQKMLEVMGIEIKDIEGAVRRECKRRCSK